MMKNCYSFLIALFFLTSLFSQKKKSIELTGTVFSDSLLIEHVHIINKTSLKGTITNSNGIFKLPVNIGDTLHISHINYEIKNLVISITENITKKISVHLSAKTHALNEVFIKKKRSIFYVDPQIMPHAMVNATTLKLPYANVKAPPENKNIIRPESGLSVNLVSLINTFNGKRKKAKELKNAKISDQKHDALRGQFQDSFFYVDLKIRKGFINQFIAYCIKEGIHDYKEKDNIIKLTNYLIQKSKTYSYKQIDLDTLVSKH